MVEIHVEGNTILIFLGQGPLVKSQHGVFFIKGHDICIFNEKRWRIHKSAIVSVFILLELWNAYLNLSGSKGTW